MALAVKCSQLKVKLCQKLTEIVVNLFFFNLHFIVALLLFLTGRYRHSLEWTSHIRSFPHRCRMRHGPDTEGGTGRAEGWWSEATHPLMSCLYSPFNTDLRWWLEGCGGTDLFPVLHETTKFTQPMCVSETFMFDFHRTALQWWDPPDTMPPTPPLCEYIGSHTYACMHTIINHEPGGLCEVFERIFGRSSTCLSTHEKVKNVLLS